ncbi:hypothetical protein P873_03145 [Arenimonas composti TR7-09 = DSM 18010]|uniref:DUF721 domain-containing protein n=2 Tax=Arenimonas TaxID=490567 RepID=A0A091BHP4_9GAMM|nr:hypothetical protein P873_03145 [Arenimonas composti TR7-09 = DSM 18010]
MSNPFKPGARSAASARPPRQPLEALAGSGLANLVDRVRWLDALDRVLRQSLPATLAGQCRLANVDENSMVFLVSAPVWKASLRLHADVLRDAAAAAGIPARTLVVKVAPPEPVVPTGPDRSKPLSEAVRDSLRATAHSVSDPGLRAQLLKLAAASGKSTDDA